MDIRNIMDTVQEVALAFKFSAKRVLAFEEQLMNNAAVREEMGRQSKLKILCETRWASRADSLNVFVSSLQVSSLSIISGMKRLKTPLRSTMSDERLSSLTVLHVHKHKKADVDQVISEFAGKKDRRLSLCL